MKNKKNYFDEIRNYGVEDKFIEHIIRILFFTVVIGIETFLQRAKGVFFHIKNFFMNRRMSDMLSKYTKYKESVQSLMERAVNNRNLHKHVHEVINSHFSEYEKRIVFGFRESKDSLISSSRRMITSMKGYTKKMRVRYFEYIPEISVTKKVSSAIISVQLLRKFGKNTATSRNRKDIAEKIQYLNSVAKSYRKFMAGKYEKFYSEEFIEKVTKASTGMKTVRKNMDQILDTMKRVEQRHAKYRLGSSSN